MGRNRKQTQLLAYFAGIFDGEGFVGAQGPDPNGLCVVIGMTDPRPLGMIWREYPEARLYLRPNRGTPWKPCFIVRLNYYRAERFLRDIEPFCLAKREQVKVALSFLAHRRRDHLHGKHLDTIGRHNGFDCHGRCQRFMDTLRQLKQDPQGVKSVNLYDLREYRAKPEDVAEDARLIDEQFQRLRDGVETRDRAATPVEPISAPEKEIVQAA